MDSSSVSSMVTPDVMPPNIQTPLPNNSVLQNYILERTIGQGGFGITYLGTEKLTGRRVVIKENFPRQYVYRDPQDAVTVYPRPGYEGDYDWSKQSFIKEAVTLIGLPYNPHIVRVLAVLEAHNTAYIVMPLIEGRDMAACYRGGATMPENELHDFLQSILGALAHMHAHNIIHRDIKPENILITPEGKPVLIDFGAARPDTPMVSATQIGTRGYAPPEQISPKLYDKHPKPHADIYALGATCYRLITGYDPDYVPYRLAQDSAINGSYSYGLLSSIDKARDLLPGNRWQSAQEWIDAISAPTEKQLAEMVAKAAKLINEQRYSDIMTVLRPALEQNYAPAQYIMGACYQDGTGTEKDPQLAFHWYRKAAEQNHVKAQFYLGDCYFKGKGTEKDPQLAFHWYRKAAEQNHDAAQFYLGYCYNNGIGTEKSPQLAVHWYRKAAEQNSHVAQNNLGTCYLHGTGVEKNARLAVHWYRKAAEQNFALAMDNLGYCYECGLGVPRDMNQAVYWYRKAADNGCQSAKDALKKLGR
ncbi:MAG: serine/threonine-protein kinase [Akkermansia sp.]|nr:serine/threonine-protein kinase [Akkermansia sp.]